MLAVRIVSSICLSLRKVALEYARDAPRRRDDVVRVIVHAEKRARFALAAHERAKDDRRVVGRYADDGGDFRFTRRGVDVLDAIVRLDDDDRVARVGGA